MKAIIPTEPKVVKRFARVGMLFDDNLTVPKEKKKL
jgi:hypothetical protein